jgi:hypothetical protein
LDCSAGFVSEEKKSSFASLVSISPEENIVTFEEPDIVEFPPPPPKAPKGKGRAKKTAPQAYSQIITRPSLNTLVEPPIFPRNPFVSPYVVPSDTPSAFDPHSIAIPSHSGTFLLSLPRKRKAALLDTSATSLKAPNTLALIENVDMVQLMLESELAGGPLSAYIRLHLYLTDWADKREDSQAT